MNGPFDFGDVSPRRYFAGAAIVLGLLFAFVAGDDETPAELSRSLLLWQIQACVPMVLLVLSHVLWLRVAYFEARGPWTQLLVSGLTGSLLFSPVAALLDRYLEGDTDPLVWGTVLNEALNIAPPITLAWLAMNAPFVLGLRLTNVGGRNSGPREADSSGPDAARSDEAEQAAGAAGLPTDETKLPTFMTLVAPSVRGRLLYLQAELHYLAVVTDQGRSLILYNLRDAVRELPEDLGLMTHRSFWVTRVAVRRLRRSGRQGVLGLENGDEIPVSRRRLASVSQLLAGAADTDS